MLAIQAIPTQYQGYLFRSRLEARWAVFFTTLSIRWEYEPEGYMLADGTSYLPDFWLPQVRMFAEVKPACLGDDIVEIGDEAMRKVIGLVEGTGHPVLILDGVPSETNYWSIWPDPVLGWTWEDVYLSDRNYYHLTEGRFYVCTGALDRRHVRYIVDNECPGVIAARAARFGERMARQ